MSDLINMITLLLGTLLLIRDAASTTRPPHIILILADDMGWNDVGFHGSDEIPTPNIDALAYNGVILNNYYSQSICTPSRAALLSGKYPIHTGTQHRVILDTAPWGLGLEERLLPELLNDAGYSSHAIGKWHLGFFKREYTPTYRGFKSHFGYWQGFQGYYNHTAASTFDPYIGYDMRRNMDVDWNARGHYSTDLFTQEAVSIISNHDNVRPLFLYMAHLAPHTGNPNEPYEAPDETIAKFRYIKDPKRRVYAAMVSKLDDSVGDVVTALRAKNMLENSVVIFMSDNGAPTENGFHTNSGSNYPLRGLKDSAWEGGNRVLAAVWSPLIEKPGRVSNQLMHVTDWLPTLYSLTGRNSSDLENIDGLDLWNTLSLDTPSPRKEMLYNIDQIDPYWAIRYGDWKYINGSVSITNSTSWYGHDGKNLSVEYDTQAVLNSKAEVTISGYWTMKQIDALAGKQRNSNITVESIPESLTTSKILMLRSQAEVNCSTEPPVECSPSESPCLFNLIDDPCEQINLASTHTDIVQQLETILLRYKKSVIQPRNKPGDKNADPDLWGGVWTPWMDNNDTGFNLSGSKTWIIVGSVVVFIGLFILGISMRTYRSRDAVSPEIATIS